MASPINVGKLQATAERYMTDTATISRDNPVTGKTPTTVAAGVACMVQPITRQAVVGLPGASPESMQQYLIRFPLGTDVAAGDLVTITSWTPTVVFSVVAPRAPRTPQVQMDVEATRFTGTV